MAIRRAAERTGFRWGGAGLALLAGMLAVASASWACTTIMGTMTLDPTSGRPGRAVTATASGLSSGATTTYTLRFNDAVRNASGASCHTAPVILAANVPTTNGAFTVTFNIPKPTPKGKTKVCGKDDNNDSYGTQHKTFTVI